MESAIFIIWVCCIAYIVFLPRMPENYAYWCHVFMQDWYAIRNSEAWDRIYR